MRIIMKTLAAGPDGCFAPGRKPVEVPDHLAKAFLANGCAEDPNAAAEETPVEPEAVEEAPAESETDDEPSAQAEAAEEAPAQEPAAPAPAKKVTRKPAAKTAEEG